MLSHYRINKMTGKTWLNKISRSIYLWLTLGHNRRMLSNNTNPYIILSHDIGNQDYFREPMLRIRLGSISVRLSLTFVSQLFVEPPCMSHDGRICNENLLCQRALVLWSDIWLEAVRSDVHVLVCRAMQRLCRVPPVIMLLKFHDIYKAPYRIVEKKNSTVSEKKIE